MSDDIDPDATVWVKTGVAGSVSANCLHLDRTCPALKRADTVSEKRRRMYPRDARLCKKCTNDQSYGGGERSAAYKALKRAAEANDD